LEVLQYFLYRSGPSRPCRPFGWHGWSSMPPAASAHLVIRDVGCTVALWPQAWKTAADGRRIRSRAQLKRCGPPCVVVVPGRGRRLKPQGPAPPSAVTPSTTNPKRLIPSISRQAWRALGVEIALLSNKFQFLEPSSGCAVKQGLHLDALCFQAAGPSPRKACGHSRVTHSTISRCSRNPVSRGHWWEIATQTSGALHPELKNIYLAQAPWNCAESSKLSCVTSACGPRLSRSRLYLGQKI